MPWPTTRSSCYGALLHDIGKAIDPHDHVAAGLEALDGFITKHTQWFIEHHMDAQQDLDGTLGMRARRRLKQSPDYDDLLTLARCDRGRPPNRRTSRLSSTRRSTTSAKSRNLSAKSAASPTAQPSRAGKRVLTARYHSQPIPQHG